MTHDTPAELLELERIIEAGGTQLQTRVVARVETGGRNFPVHAVCLGNASPEVPAVGFFGGVHGLERIGAEVVLAYLNSLVQRLQWDTSLHRQLESLRLVFMPIVNPGGLWRGTRANPQGVDLMRNAPVDAGERALFMVGGQRLSADLPWYRGAEGAAMEVESAALCALVQQELLSHPFSLALDCHSGFGLNDRLWFPYAHRTPPMAHLAEIHALKHIFDQSHPVHRYLFEPQSRHYLAHGDLWDHLYGLSLQQPERIFLPLTLEMGSWLWVKKNPRQLFSRHGIFNPLITHRQQRVLRSHMVWLDFLTRAASGHSRWLPRGGDRDLHEQQALDLWYRRQPLRNKP